MFVFNFFLCIQNFQTQLPNVLISVFQIDILLQFFYKIIQEIFEKIFLSPWPQSWWGLRMTLN